MAPNQHISVHKYSDCPAEQPQQILVRNYPSTSSAFSSSAHPDEDWTKVSDLAERRRIQNRIAQRNYRKKIKERMADLERRASSDGNKNSNTNSKKSPNSSKKRQRRRSLRPPSGHQTLQPPSHSGTLLLPFTPLINPEDHLSSSPSSPPPFASYQPTYLHDNGMTMQSYGSPHQQESTTTGPYQFGMVTTNAAPVLPPMTHFAESPNLNTGNESMSSFSNYGDYTLVGQLNPLAYDSNPHVSSLRHIDSQNESEHDTGIPHCVPFAAPPPRVPSAADAKVRGDDLSQDTSFSSQAGPCCNYPRLTGPASPVVHTCEALGFCPRPKGFRAMDKEMMPGPTAPKVEAGPEDIQQEEPQHSRPPEPLQQYPSPRVEDSDASFFQGDRQLDQPPDQQHAEPPTPPQRASRPDVNAEELGGPGEDQNQQLQLAAQMSQAISGVVGGSNPEEDDFDSQEPNLQSLQQLQDTPEDHMQGQEHVLYELPENIPFNIQQDLQQSLQHVMPHPEGQQEPQLSQHGQHPSHAHHAQYMDPQQQPPHLDPPVPMGLGQAQYGVGDVPRKRSKVSRACDECRRKKVKCNTASETGEEACFNCQRSNVRCLFSRVPQKRGPSKGYTTPSRA